MRRVSVTLCAVLDAAGVALLVFFLAICKLSPALGVLAIVAAVGLWGLDGTDEDDDDEEDGTNQ